MKSLIYGLLTFSLISVFVIGVCPLTYAGGQSYSSNEDPNKKVLKQGLLGAGTGAIAASASGGKAGTGALIGAGTNVIGGALLDTITAPSQPQGYASPPPQQVYQQGYAPQQGSSQGYVQQAPQQGYYQDPPRQQPYYATPQPYPTQQPDPNKQILKQGLLGAGTGAIAAGASGGKAGKGALIGAGTNILGGALLDVLSGPSQPAPQQQPVYYPPQQQPQSYYGQQAPQGTKKIIRKYDAEGKVISEEEVYQ
jgi:hypothetical protein